MNWPRNITYYFSRKNNSENLWGTNVGSFRSDTIVRFEVSTDQYVNFFQTPVYFLSLFD